MATRFILSLLLDLMAASDRQIVRERESRDEAICRLIQAANRQVHERAEVERYIRGYLQTPQLEDEFGWLDSVAPESLSELPWE